MYLWGNLPVRLATQRKSLPKFNLSLLPTTCESVWPRLNSPTELFGENDWSHPDSKIDHVMSSFGFLLYVGIYERPCRNIIPWRSAKINKYSAVDPNACALCYCLGILDPRGRAPFGQHQESRPLARSNDIPVLNSFVNTIDWDQNQSDLSDLTLNMLRVTRSPWIADFRCQTWPEVAILGAAQKESGPWGRKCCLGYSGPFVWDTSPKSIDREGLGESHTGTRQG